MKPIQFGKSLSLQMLGGYLSGEMKLVRFSPIIEHEEAKVMVEIEPQYDDPDHPSGKPRLPDAARAGIEWLIANEADAAAAVMDAIVEKFPKLKQPLRKYVDLDSVKFHGVQNGALPYIGYELACSWDDEHGLGLMMHGTRLVEIGSADVALLEWIAEGDAKKTGKAKPAAAAKSKPKATAAKKNGAKKPAAAITASSKKSAPAKKSVSAKKTKN